MGSQTFNLLNISIYVCVILICVLKNVCSLMVEKRKTRKNSLKCQQKEKVTKFWPQTILYCRKAKFFMIIILEKREKLKSNIAK